VEDIAAAPLRWLGLLGRKGLMVWSAAEIADTGDFDTHVAWSPVLRGLSLAWHFGVLAPLAAAGAVLTWRDRRRHGILYALILGYAAATAVFYLFARYRYPLVPMLVPLAAAGVVTAINPIGRREWRRLIVAGCVATVVAIVSNAAWVLPPRLRGADHYNRALAHVRRNEPERAAEAYRRALRVNPRLVDARNNLGLLLAGQGQIDAAIEQYAAALALRDDDPAVHNNIGMALAQAGRRGEAIDHFQRAVRLQPDLTPAWFNLGVALAMEGRPDDAAAALETVLRRDPSHSGASQWLARVRPSPATLPTTAP
jgi:tetratricopeptide (TPR) repeat protein